MGWPLSKDKQETPVETKTEVKEKSVAEVIAEALQPISARFDSIDAKFTDLEGKVVQKPTKPETPEQRQKTSFLDNEDQAFNERAAPLAVETMVTRFELMFDRISREYEQRLGAETWGEIAPEVRKNLEATENLILRANPVYIRNTVRMVMGEKAEGGFRFDKTGKRFFLEDASTSSTTTSGARPEDGMSARQLKAAKAFGMSLEDYKKSMGGLEVIQ